MSDLPDDVRKQLEDFISKTTNQAVNLATNLFGIYIDEKMIKKNKKRAERETTASIEWMIGEVYRRGINIKEKYEREEVESFSAKEKFFFVTDELMRPFFPEIPENIHVMDSMFQACDQLKDFRFELPYLKHTGYLEYVQTLEKLLDELKKRNKLDKVLNLLNKFKDSRDAYTLLQATFQKLLYYYEFLRHDFPVIKKKEIDKYLEIYEELSGQYEKCVSLIVALVELSTTGTIPRYQDVRKRRLYRNMAFVQEHGWSKLISGFNRDIRNAIAHRTYKVDLINATVDFCDMDKIITLTFADFQRESRELSALFLVLPHMIISVLCSAALSVREALENLPDQIT